VNFRFQSFDEKAEQIKKRRIKRINLSTFSSWAIDFVKNSPILYQWKMIEKLKDLVQNK
jgi:hypothetical protein